MLSFAVHVRFTHPVCVCVCVCVGRINSAEDINNSIDCSLIFALSCIYIYIYIYICVCVCVCVCEKENVLQ